MVGMVPWAICSSRKASNNSCNVCVPQFSEDDEYKDGDASDADGDGDGDRYVDVDERAHRPT